MPLAGAGTRERIYFIQSGDSFDVKFYYTPDLNESVVVRPDGKVSLQLVGDVQAAGMSIGELEQAVGQRYAKILRDPQVTIVVKQFQPQKVFVGGEVRAPGEVLLQGDMTALQAITRAGFFTPDAEARNVVVLRYKGSDGPEFITINMKALIDRQKSRSSSFPDNPGQDVLLQPLDVVFVPQTTISSVADFFSRYLNKIIPIWANTGFSFNYYVNEARFRPVTP